MVNKCSIPRANINSSPSEEELMDFAYNELIPFLATIFDSDAYYDNDVLSPTRMKQAVVAFIRSLGTSYATEDYKYISQAFDLIRNDEIYGWLSQIIPNVSIQRLLKAKGTAEELSSKIFTDQIEDDTSTEYDAVNYFLNNAYGSAILAKTQLERKMNNVVLNSFVIDRANGNIVSDLETALLNVEHYKRELFKDIQAYFQEMHGGLGIATADLIGTPLEELMRLHQREISQHLQVGLFSSSQLQDLYDKANVAKDSPEKRKAKLTLDAYGSWLALQHFDNFIKMSVGDTIIINPSSPTRYEYSTKGTNVNTTWRKDDNIDLQAEINKLTQALINTSPMIQFGTNLVSENAYLQFSDFSYITAKIKDLVYDSQAATTFFDKEDMKYVRDNLSIDEQNLIKNKSFRQIISNSRYNPQKYLPIIYKILVSYNGNTPFVDRFSSVFNKQDKNLLWTIYKNIYDTNYEGMSKNHSLYSIQQKNPTSKNYFAAVSSVADCIFSVDFVQYVFDNGTLKMRTLRDAAVDKTRKEIENIINTKNSSELTGAFDFAPYNIKEHIVNDKFNGVTFTLPLSTNEPLYIHITNMGEEITFSKSPNINGQALDTDELRSLISEQSIKEFFDEVLGLNLGSNAAFRQAYREMTKQGTDDESPYISQILSLASNVFFNRYFSQTYLSKRPTRAGKIDTMKDLFPESLEPRFNDRFFNMEMISRKHYDTLLSLAQALGSTRGLNSSRQVKDSDNAMLSSQTLSRLLGNMVQQLDVQINTYNKLKDLKAQLAEVLEEEARDGESDITHFRKAQLQDQIRVLRDSTYTLDTDLDPAASDFSLITNPTLFKGILKSEEIKGAFGNKKQVKFTTAEAVISSFLHNFVLGHCDPSVLEANSELGNGVVGLLPSVNSDKTTVSIAKFDLNAYVNGVNGVRYRDLDGIGIMGVIKNEIGKFYDTMYHNVKVDFDKLSQLTGVAINPDDNFTALRVYVETYNANLAEGEPAVTMQSFLFDKTKEYNELNPTNPIRLIDQIHYIADKKGNITFNNTIKSLKERFSTIEGTQEFFRMKSVEVLKSALDSDFSISLYGNKNLDEQPEIGYLRNDKSCQGWCNISGQMIIAKYNFNGVDYDISNKTDLLVLEDRLTLDRMAAMGISDYQNKFALNKQHYKELCGFDRLSTKIHLLKDNLRLHPMLEKYNLFDYLFTQQLMLSTVGSHVAHPAKGKFDTLLSEKQLVNNTPYRTSLGIVPTIRLVDTIDTTREVPVAARRIQEGENSVILLNLPLLKTKYENGSWTTPAVLSDGTQAKALDPNSFNSFEEFLTFVIEHETARIVNRRHQGESLGTYETRINELALKGLKVKLQQRLLAEEASRFYAQHKRNVSFTASMDQFQLNQIDGIPLWYNIAIIDDIKEDLFTIDGQTNDAKPFDGATFVNPIIMYLENNSLNEARAGIDKKQFVHYYDELTGSGGIIKTAGFAITNDRMRNSVFYRDMMKNMTNRVWKDYTGADYVADITKDFRNQDVNYGVFYFKEGTRYYKASIAKNAADNTYDRTVVEVDKTGQEIGIPETNPYVAKTNYDLWLMFGGMHSQDFNGGELQPSETSLQLVTKAVINHGKVKPSGYNKDGSLKSDITAEYLDQPLKNADIHYMPTIGAVKQGAANINPKSHYYGDNTLNFFRIKMTNAGIQLDKEHHADGSTLSLMTQVISSACSMGYNPVQAEKLYKALYNLTMQGIKEFKEGFKEILNPPNGVLNPEAKFETAIADCMIKNMLTSTAQDGDMLRAIATELIKKAREGKELTFKDTKIIPYSDPAVFNKLVTNLSVIMTKAGIKAKMNGVLSVLCPTQNIVKMYSFLDENGKKHTYTLSQLEEYFGGDYNQIIKQVQAQQSQLDILKCQTDTSDVEIGTKYLVELIDGTQVIFDVKFPHSHRKLKTTRTTPLHSEPISEEIIGYQTFKELLQSGKIKAAQEWAVDGRELGSINYKFKGLNGQNYQVWDINYIQDLFETMKIAEDLDNDQDRLNLYLQLIEKYDGNLDKLNEGVKHRFASYDNGGAVGISHKLKLAKLYAKQIQQDILFALSTNNPTKVKSVKIGSDDVVIDKQSIQVKPYELVMPKIFLKEFGLDEYSNLDEIKNNPDYFYDRMVNNFDTKVFDETHYDLELKKVNGQHIYLKDRAGITDDWYRDVERVIIHKKVDELGQIWRIDPATNKRMYQLFSDSDEVYRITGTNTEIILTSSMIGKNKKEERIVNSGLTFYLNNFKYQSLHISEAIAAGERDQFDLHLRPQFNNLLEIIDRSTNRSAKSWIKLFKGTDKTKKWVEGPALNTELNNFNQLGHRLQSLLREQATNIHTSLLKSLDIIAARIPAQNQQSFMPMKVVAWDNPNINTAYVSVMQFFLQGSDLDIDAVSLLTHSFSENGEFHIWSPDFNMSHIDLLNQSLQLPFPTGNKVKETAYDSTEVHVNEANRLPLLTDNKHYQALIAYEIYKASPEAQNIPVEAQIQNEKKALQHYIELLKFVEDCNGEIAVATKAELESAAVRDIINRINKHNTYLNSVSDDVSSGAIKNYVVSALYSISSDAANLLEAHTGVDVATGPLKKIASASELSEVQKTFTPGNVFNKFQAIEEASVGKDDIAICATGLKAFFASTQFCNSYLNRTLQDPYLSPDEVRQRTSLITFEPVKIGGRTFDSLANIRVDELSEHLQQTNPQIYNMLKDKGFDDDASIVMSALLSLSTDNAKELCLAKINAGTSMIGMYLYGAAIGMDFEVMNKIIASPLGFTIAKLLNSNEFTLKQGKTSVDAALSYLFDGPSLRNLVRFNSVLYNETTNVASKSVHDVFIENVKAVFELPKYKIYIQSILGKENITENLNIKNFGRTLSTIVRYKDPNNPTFNSPAFALDLLQVVNTRVNNYISNFEEAFAATPHKYRGYQALSNQLHNFFNEYVSQVSTLRDTKYTTAYGTSDIKDDLNKLALGADEFKRLGQFLRLNQEIKTKPDELISFVQKIENVLVDRAKLIKRVKQRLGESYEPSEQIAAFDFKKFAESFISRPNDPNAYHNKWIELYEQNCKTCINPLRVLTTVDHYKGYLESMILAYEGDYMKSVKFRAIKHLGNTFIQNYKVQSSQEKTQVYKGVQNFVDDYMNNAYLSSQPIFKLPKTTKDRTVKIYDIYGNAQENTVVSAPIQLGTEQGNITFEHFFEDVFLPALKQQKSDNEFIRDLDSVLVTDSVTGIRYLAKSLSINMMPSSENERIIFNKYKNDFSKLQGEVIKIGTQEYSIVQMFQYYNLLKFKGRSGRNSLSSIFEDIMATDEHLKEYREFINNFDSAYDFVIGVNPVQEETAKRTLIGISPEILFKYIAPTANPLTATADVIKYKNRNTGTTILLERKPDTSSIDASYEDEGYFGTNPMDDDSEGFGSYVADDVFMENMSASLDVDNPDYGNYQPFGGNGVLTRFNPPSTHQAQTPELVLDTYSTNGVTITNIRILDGVLKQFTYNGNTIVMKEPIPVVREIRQKGKPEQYILDESIVNSIIKKELICG